MKERAERMLIAFYVGCIIIVGILLFPIWMLAFVLLRFDLNAYLLKMMRKMEEKEREL